MLKKKLPAQLFARIETDGTDADDCWLSASQTLKELMAGDDGPETVGVYQLVETRRVEKVIQAAKARK